MPRGKAHPPRVRKNAEALLLAGHSQAEVCELTGLDSGLISRWAATSQMKEQLQQLAAKKTDSDGELIMNYFRAALRAMASQADVFGDPTYARSQNIRDLAIAHGVLGDKLAGIAATAQALGLIGSPTAEAALPAGSADDRD